MYPCLIRYFTVGLRAKYRRYPILGKRRPGGHKCIVVSGLEREVYGEM